MSFCAICSGVGCIGTSLFGAEKVSAYEVTAKSSGRLQRKECDISLTVRLPETVNDTKICVTDAFWISHHIGDKGTLKIKTSPMGNYIDYL
jgi:hypothetical protein